MIDFKKLLKEERDEEKQRRNMPRKTYDFDEAEPDAPAIVTEMKRISKEITTKEPAKDVIHAVRCTNSKCDFYFDMGTDETKTNAARTHSEKTGHGIAVEYV